MLHNEKPNFGGVDRMVKKLYVNLLCVVGCVLVLFSSGCQTNNINEKSVSEKKLNVVATFGMITDIVDNVGGEKIDLTGIMGEGVDPHLYKPTAKDTKLLLDANIVFYNGLNLEVRIIGTILDRMEDRTKAVAVADDIPIVNLRPATEFMGGYDPHVWHNVALWMKATEKVRDTLSHADAKNSAYFHSNATQYLNELQSLHEDLQKLVAQIPSKRRVLVTTHDAFGYLGKAYGFEVRGLMGINTENEVGIADVRELAKYIIDRRISTMFVETSAAPQGIHAVRDAVKAQGFNVKIGGKLYADAMGTPGTFEGTYIGMMRHNMDTIVNSLQTELAYQRK